MANKERDKKKDGKRYKKRKEAKKIENEESEPQRELETSKHDKDEISDELGEGDNQLFKKEEEGNRKKMKHKKQKVAKKLEDEESEPQGELETSKQDKVEISDKLGGGDNQKEGNKKKKYKSQKVAKKLKDEELEPQRELETSKRADELGEGDNQSLENEEEGNRKKMKYKRQKVAKKLEDEESEPQRELETSKRDKVEISDELGEGDNQSLGKGEEGNRKKMKYKKQKEAKKLEEPQWELETSKRDKAEISDELGDGDNQLLEKKEEGNKTKMKSKSESELGSPSPQITNSDVPSKLKRPRSAVEDSGEENKRSKSVRFSKVFTDEDEVLILEGLDEYMEARKEEKEESTLDMKGFLEFVNKSLSFEVRRTQLYEKIRRLRNKYEKSLKKGINANFSTPHEKKIHKLSGKLWGERGPLTLVSVSAQKKNVKASKNVEVKVEVPKQTSVDLMGNSNLEDFGTLEQLDLIEESKRAELEEKRKKLDLLKLEHFLRRVTFEQEVTQTILEAYKKEKGGKDVSGPSAIKK